MEVLGLSIVTDLCLPDALEVADISEIIAIAGEAEPRMTSLMSKVVAEI
jgi:purine-nucleoside phosphorylase